ncbi:putative transcriptional regulator, GntR family [Catenulispora acidiphila DSM 44928]|uniref:Putative transcriptional regulator, GntR family n=1 Tax=Catenulispora acidiphila (strain DSM 44928 / JCM 14897 / NBRC 102108 / NRRL B-24433 / ID139908) TaxID=479433 RepID=C7QKB0_CATAD|nr:PLP-dependent aminotransferase family protein [Catenulispora acidiphila]ACU75184.1 putative transcriptional regulator, GntR family [Catenulispora acidiphila DSM 44928]
MTTTTPTPAPIDVSRVTPTPNAPALAPIDLAPPIPTASAPAPALAPVDLPRPIPTAPAPIDLSQPVFGAAASFPSSLDPARALAEAAPALAAHLSDFHRHPAGLPDLRAAVAERYTRRGVPTTPDHIVVTSSPQAALALAIGLFCAPEDRVLVENPTHPDTLAVLRSCAVRPVPIPLGGNGITPADLPGRFVHTAARLAHFSAGYQNPTGHLPSAEVRLAAAESARRSGTWLIADETAIEPVLDGVAPEPFTLGVPRAAAERIVTIGAPSQTHGLALRVGWLRATPRTAAALARHQADAGLGASALDQILTTNLLHQADADLPAHRAQLRERRAALESALTRLAPEWSWRHPAGGLTLWVDLGRPAAAALTTHAANAGVHITPGSRFTLDPGAHDHHIPLPFTLPAPALTEAACRLATAWHQTLSTPRSPDRHMWTV